MKTMRELMEAVQAAFAPITESAEQYVNPSPQKIMRMFATEKDGIRLLWYPDGTLVVWPTIVDDHRGMNRELERSGGIRFIIVGDMMVVRPVNTEDERITQADWKAAMADPRLAPLVDLIKQGKLKFDMAE